MFFMGLELHLLTLFSLTPKARRSLAGPIAEMCVSFKISIGPPFNLCI